MRAIALCFLLLCAIPASSRAQFNGCQGGFCGASKAAVTYTGPADINGSALIYWGFECISNAYSGNVADVWDSTTGSTLETLITCSPGGTLNQTVNVLATTCASGCNVKTLYDQSGGAQCSGPCDATQATNASRPALTTSLLGSKYGMTCSGTFLISPSVAASTAQPVTYVFAARRTSGVTNQSDVIGNTTHSPEVGFNTANVEFTYTGNSFPNGATATDNVYHAVQTVANASGGTSATYIDGTNTALPSLSGSNGVGTGSYGICAQAPAGGGLLNGNFLMGGFWAGDKSTNNSAMNSLIHTFWGF